MGGKGSQPFAIFSRPIASTSCALETKYYFVRLIEAGVLVKGHPWGRVLDKHIEVDFVTTG